MSNPASQNPKPLSNLGSLRASGAHWPEREVSRHRATGSVLTAAARLSLILPSLRVRRPYRLGRSPSCPSLRVPSSTKASLSPGASQPSPGKSLAARFQLSLLWGAPRYRDHRSQGNEAWAGGGHERARGAHGARGWPGRCSPRPAGRTGCRAPAAPPSPDSPRSASSPLGDPGPISQRVWERDREGTWATLPPLPEGSTRRSDSQHCLLSRPLSGDRGRLHRATDTTN